MSHSIQDQLIQEHASLICFTVAACSDEALKQQLLEDLVVSEQNGWGKLCSGIRRILDGARHMNELEDCDVEDEAILQAILLGLADPSTLPNPSANSNPILAPGGLAGIIHEAANGDENALHMLARMDKDLQDESDPELQALGRALRRLLNGERHAETLTMGMNERTVSLVEAIINELNQMK